MHNSTPEVTETYGHNGDIVASPIHEHQYQYPAYGQYASAEYPRGWATDSPMSTQVASTDVPDEYRASIARHCDAIHASGSHGLESDNNVAPVRTYPSRLPREEKVEPDQPRGRKVWNSEIAAAAYHSLVGHPVRKILFHISVNKSIDLPYLAPASRDGGPSQSRRAADGRAYANPIPAVSGRLHARAAPDQPGSTLSSYPVPTDSSVTHYKSSVIHSTI